MLWFSFDLKVSLFIFVVLMLYIGVFFFEFGGIELFMKNL